MFFPIMRCCASFYKSWNKTSRISTTCSVARNADWYL